MPMFRKPPLILPRPKPSPGRTVLYESALTASGVFRALEATKSRVNAVSLIGAVITLGGLAGGLYAVAGIARSEAAEKIAPLDAGLKTTNERIDNTNERVDFLKTTLLNHIDDERVQHARDEQQHALMLDALGVPKWKRPEPLDGGK